MKAHIAAALLITIGLSPDGSSVFEHLKELAGTWRSVSTKGWTETSTIEVAAKGSAVIERSHFEGEPNDGMITVYFMDGDRLMITHYCEAKNQPTLVASAISPGGKHVEFTFDHATNLSSKAAGHMHGLVLDFIDADHFRSRWSWSANGKETWFETVDSVRVR